MSDPDPRYSALLGRLRDLGSLLVAYSGGVDSTLLAAAAHEALGDRMLAVLAVSETYPRAEIDDARATARALGLPLLEIETHELDDPAFAANPPDRCYHCKLELFGALRAIADARGLAYIADGTNADDRSDHRPGRTAARELGVVSPLDDADLSKTDIRELSRALGLPTAEKPSMACLSSRFPYGSTIERTGLDRVDRAETAMRELGLRQLRVRVHGDIARVEVAPEELDAAWEIRAEIAAAVHGAGFAYVALDLDGYRTGSLNETI